MRTDRERIATIEQVLRERERLIAEYQQERRETMRRLDDLEEASSVLLADKKAHNSQIAERQRRIELRIQVLTVVVAVAAFIEPVFYHYTGGR